MQQRNPHYDPMTATLITREQVTEAETQLFSAQLTGNADALAHLLHDDLLALSPTGQVMTKAMDVDAYRSGAVVLATGTTEIEEIRLTGDTAVPIVSLRAKGTVMGNPLEGHFRYIRVWKLVDDRLQIIGASFMQVV